MNERVSTNRRRMLLAALAAGASLQIPRAFPVERTNRIVVRSWKMNDAPSVGEGITPPLGALGYVVGKNLVIVEDELPHPDDSPELLAKRIASIRSAPVHAVVDVSLLAEWWCSVLPGTPVVAWGSTDPVAEGIAKSFTRPGGWITGTTQGHAEIARKQVDYLRRMVPNLSGIAIFGYGRTGELRTPAFRLEQECYERAVTEAHLKMTALRPAPEDLSSLRNRGFQAAIVMMPVMKNQIRKHAPIAIEYRIATIGYWIHMPENGLLASYGELREEWFKRLALQLDRIFRGARPQEMPFIHPSQFHFRLNRSTAKALGLVIPDDLLMLADSVVE